MGGHAMLLDMHLHMHTADGTGGALNKHAHTPIGRRTPWSAPMSLNECLWGVKGSKLI